MIRRSHTLKYLCWYILASSVCNVGQCHDLEKDLTEINVKQFIVIKDLKGSRVIHQMPITSLLILMSLALVTSNWILLWAKKSHKEVSQQAMR
jgi:hypothetical protein